MADRERAADRGSRVAHRDLVTLGAELRTARIMTGKTQQDVGRAVGMSYSNVGRIERAALPSATVTQLAKIGAVVGLDVRVRAYPGGSPLRDAGQIALFDRLRVRLSSNLVMRTEVPLQIEGDQRAWDARIVGFEPAADPLHAEVRPGCMTHRRNSAGSRSRHVILAWTPCSWSSPTPRAIGRRYVRRDRC
jgi:transcriptional regulator with XRE-family HTH domain